MEVSEIFYRLDKLFVIMGLIPKYMDEKAEIHWADNSFKAKS